MNQEIHRQRTTRSDDNRQFRRRLKIGAVLALMLGNSFFNTGCILTDLISGGSGLGDLLGGLGGLGGAAGGGGGSGSTPTAANPSTRRLLGANSAAGAPAGTNGPGNTP